MQFKKGDRIIINGERRVLKSYIHKIIVNLFAQRKRILIVDTSNSLNHHHPAFNTVKQRLYFDYIYCVRTPMPYDLWARLGSSESFISRKKIDVILFTNLSLLFKEGNKNESLSLANNILKRIDNLTRNHNLVAIIGNSPAHDETANSIFEYLSDQPRVMEVAA
jgi:hypothetical protein